MDAAPFSSRRLGVVVLALALFAFAGLTAAAPALADVSPSASASVSSSPSPAPTVTCSLAPAAVIYGQSVLVSGAVTPVAADQQVTILCRGSAVATAQTLADGTYSVALTPTISGPISAKLADGTESTAVALAVSLKVTITHAAPYPFLPTRYVCKVSPSTYSGVVVASVVHRGRVVATVRGKVKNGQVVLLVPTPGIQRFTVKFTVPAGSGLGARGLASTFAVGWRRVLSGSSGPYAHGVLLRLAALHVHVPGVGSVISRNARDAIMAFQKAYRLPRNFVIDADDWLKLDTAKIIAPRVKTAGTHLEVDKGRQILMVVRGGKVYGLIAISTGKTGNTPEGAFRIRQKHLTTTPLYGTGLLWRTMGFVGNYAIHGYPSVPPYPASHGCVREPWWAADWTYRLSYVGERLYIYH